MATWNWFAKISAGFSDSSKRVGFDRIHVFTRQVEAAFVKHNAFNLSGEFNLTRHALKQHYAMNDVTLRLNGLIKTHHQGGTGEIQILRGANLKLHR